ncbi:MAG: LuxR family transcriptional regulator [Deltaproteobacteria bacterium]|nr:LuxR family transcriptional regulator [Deltaproteobacteria bacterium]
MAAKKLPLSRSPLKHSKKPGEDISFLWRIPFNHETEFSKVEIALRERIKELNCLYGIAQLAERHSDSIDDLLRDLVSFLPHSWRYPEVTCARISFQGKTYKSRGFKVTKWRQSSQILMYNEPVGEVAIFYLTERPPADEGPFLKEERALLDEVAERIGTMAARISAERELQEINRQLTVERKALQETNAALRTVLARIEEEKQEIYLNLQVNVEKILVPILHALVLELPKAQRKYVEMLQTNLEEIASPFVRHLSQTYHSLTPTEIKICNLIRSGMRTKEIAQIQGVSPATINRHREHIRRKLKIANSDVNLTTYLQSSMISYGA